jgi:hypothetical protein
MSPKHFLLTCLKIPLKDSIPKSSFLGGLLKGVIQFQYLFKLTRGSRPYLQREIVSPISFPWGSFGHKASELLSSIVKVSHGDLGCSWRSHLFVELNSLVAS